MERCKGIRFITTAWLPASKPIFCFYKTIVNKLAVIWVHFWYNKVSLLVLLHHGPSFTLGAVFDNG